MALSDEEQARLAYYFRHANAIVDLAGLPFSQESADIQQRIIRGELTCSGAIDMKIAELKAQQARQALYEARERMAITPEMIAAAEKMDPENVKATPSDEIRNPTTTTWTR